LFFTTYNENKRINDISNKVSHFLYNVHAYVRECTAQ